MEGEPLVQVAGLHRRYGTLHAVRGLDLTVARGDVLGLLGANGAGKTTTMAMLAGVLAPDSGRIQVAGHDLLTAPLAAKARLGYLPENPPLFLDLTVEEFLRHCARLRGLGPARVAAAVSRAMERCDLGDVARRLLGNLSKGYRQRAGIAQAIVHEPDLVILDEPTSGLDPGQLREVRDLIGELGTAHAVIFSTHVLAEVQSSCNRVHIIHEGRTALSASMATLREETRCYRVRLASPPPADTLRRIDAVERVEPLDDGAFEIHLSSQSVAVDGVSTALCRYGLLELTPMARSLEEVFMAVCHGDPADATGSFTGAAPC